MSMRGRGKRKDSISLLRHTRGFGGAMGNWRERWGDERLEAALDFLTLVWIAIAVALLVVDLFF
jgi:hypothetical protein